MFSLTKNKKIPSKDFLELKHQIEISQMAITSAQNQFEHVVDPALIDCYIYELNAAQLRYQYLLKDMKSREVEQLQSIKPKTKPIFRFSPLSFL